MELHSAHFLLLRFDEIEAQKSSVTDLKVTCDFSCMADKLYLLVYIVVQSTNLLNVYYPQGSGGDIGKK